jgi:hypothetical protein
MICVPHGAVWVRLGADAGIVGVVEGYIVGISTKGGDEDLDKPALAVELSGVFEERCDVLSPLEDAHAPVEEFYLDWRGWSILSPGDASVSAHVVW